MKRPAALPASLGFWHPASLLATWFGAGLLPVAPGTWGSAAAIPFALVIVTWFGTIGLLITAVVTFLVGWWAASIYAAAAGDPDPGAVVIDEVVGQWLVLLAVPLDPTLYVAAFVIFRLFDIAKPWPAGRVEHRLKGGLGVMLDDVVAGVYGYLLLVLARFALAAI